MKRFILLLSVFLSCTHQHAQNIRIEANVKQLLSGKIFLSKIKGEQHNFIDSVFVNGNTFSFNLKDPEPGVYRLTLGKSLRAEFMNEAPQFFDLIINQENSIRVNTNFNSPIDSMVILNSVENQLYYNYIKADNLYKKKIRHLLSLYSVYNREDDFFPDVQKEMARVQKSYSDSLLFWADLYPGSFAASIIKFNLMPAVDPSDGFQNMTEFLKTHFFDFITFSDERLINSQVYTQKIIEFLSLYQTAGPDQSIQEEEYIKAVDVLMERASYNDNIFDFVLDFLVDGFDHLKMEKVLVHLAENYVDKGCETESKIIMDQRLEGYKRMAIGNKVKDIVLMDEEGNTRKLSDLKNDYVLITFWATWCPHCTRLLPEIKKWYEKEKDIDLEIFSVSIDTSRFAWEEYLLINNYPWINVCNFQGWEGKVASDYNIYATPTMFIVNRERQILAKPLSFREFKKELDKILPDNKKSAEIVD